MIHILCSVYDIKADFYSPPICCKTVNEAIRIFQDACNSPGSTLNSHPDDFKLFRMGMFNDSNGSITPLEPSFLFQGGTIPTES